jgi:hypothetical protein
MHLKSKQIGEKMLFIFYLVTHFEQDIETQTFIMLTGIKFKSETEILRTVCTLGTLCGISIVCTVDFQHLYQILHIHFYII